MYGIDYSRESVVVARKTNKKWIGAGRVEIIEASVAQLPFPENTFDLVTAVETHFWWPDIPSGMREIFRVLKPGGTLAIVAEVYKGAQTRMAVLVEKYLPLSGMKFLTVDEHRELFENAGYSEVKVVTEPGKGWIRASARNLLDRSCRRYRAMIRDQLSDLLRKTFKPVGRHPVTPLCQHNPTTVHTK